MHPLCNIESRDIELCDCRLCWVGGFVKKLCKTVFLCLFIWFIWYNYVFAFDVFVRVHLVTPFGGLMYILYKVFSDRTRYTHCISCTAMCLHFMCLCVVSQFGGLMCQQRNTVFVLQYIS